MSLNHTSAESGIDVAMHLRDAIAWIDASVVRGKIKPNEARVRIQALRTVENLIRDIDRHERISRRSNERRRRKAIKSAYRSRV